jgi:hypothetical protein
MKVKGIRYSVSSVSLKSILSRSLMTGGLFTGMPPILSNSKLTRQEKTPEALRRPAHRVIGRTSLPIAFYQSLISNHDQETVQEREFRRQHLPPRSGEIEELGAIDFGEFLFTA